eukprot:5016394-Pyramimonas_sp.AAC.1
MARLIDDCMQTSEHDQTHGCDRRLGVTSSVPDQCSTPGDLGTVPGRLAFMAGACALMMSYARSAGARFVLEQKIWS